MLFVAPRGAPPSRLVAALPVRGWHSRGQAGRVRASWSRTVSSCTVRRWFVCFCCVCLVPNGDLWTLLSSRCQPPRRTTPPPPPPPHHGWMRRGRRQRPWRWQSGRVERGVHGGEGGGIAPVHSDTAAGRGGGEVGGRGGRGRVARGPRETEARGSGRGGGAARRRSASRRGMAGDQRQPPGRARGGGRPEARRAGEGRPAPSGDWAVGCAAQRERTYRVVYIQVHASSSTQRKDPQQNKKKKTSTAFPPRPRGQHEQDTRAREGRPPQRGSRRTTRRRASARPCPLAAARAHRRARPRVGAGAATRQPLAATTGADRWPAAARGARQPPPSAAPPSA